MEKSRINKLEHVPIGSAKREQVMFELINEDLEDCIEILRLLSTCENKNEQLMILAENRIDKSDIQKTVDMCELLVYYHNKVKYD
jgi:hypothetical protein